MNVVSKVSLGVAGLAIAASVAVYPWLPQRMPTHFDIEGHANGFSSRAFGAFLLPLTILAITALGFAMRAKNPAVPIVTALTSCFMLALHVLVLRAALASGDLADAMWLALGALFVGLGLLMPRVRPNRYVGIRTRWTRSSPEAWARTHRAAGRVMVIGGALFALSSVPGALAIPLRVGALLVTTVAPIAQSWWIARRLGAS